MALVSMAAAIVVIDLQNTENLRLALGILVCILALLVVSTKIILHVERELQQEEVTEVREVIEIFESPIPTRSFSSPWPKTQSRRRVRRSGRQRLTMHKRAYTKVFDPPLPGHCAFQAILRAAGKKGKIQEVMELRKKVSCMFREAFIKGETIAGHDVKKVVAAEGLNLNSYVASLEHDLWASQVEVALAARFLQVSVFIKLPEGVVKIGDKTPTHMLVYKNKHFTLHLLHKKRGMRKGEECDVERGGMMQQWSWEESPSSSATMQHTTAMTRPTQMPATQPMQNPSMCMNSGERGAMNQLRDVVPTTRLQGPTIAQSHECVEGQKETMVDLSRIPRVDLMQMVVRLPPQATIQWLRKTIAQAITLPPESLSIYMEGDMASPIPDWIDVTDPAYVICSDQPQRNSIHIIYNRNEDFYLHIPAVKDHVFVENKVADIIGVMTQFLVMTDEYDNPWTYDPSMKSHRVWVKHNVVRGGMHAVSDTLPMDDDDSTSEEIRENRWRDDVEAAGEEYHTPPMSPHRNLAQRSRSRDTGLAVTRAEALMEGPAHRFDDAWYSNIMPEGDIQAAQLHPSPVLVIEGEQQVGYMWANPRARVGQVLQEIGDQLQLPMLLGVVPCQAITWNEVARIELYEKATVRRRRFTDLRISRWELYQQPREIPMLFEGAVIDHVVLPRALPMQIVQARLDTLATWREQVTLMVLDPTTWIIHKREIPATLMQGIYEMERMRRTGPTRGGMKGDRSETPVIADMSLPSEDWVAEDFVNVILAHAPFCSLRIYHHPVASIHMLKYDLALFFNEDIQNIVITSAWCIACDSMLVSEIPGQVMVLHLLRELHELKEKAYFHAFMDPDFVVDAWVEYQVECEDHDRYEPDEQKPVPTITLVYEAEGYDCEFFDIDYEPTVLRGAGRYKQNIGDPKTAMNQWALQKLQEHVPTMNQRTAAMLFKAEARTVSAVLHSKSAHQTLEIMNAALRRADLPVLGSAHGQGSGSATHGDADMTAHEEILAKIEEKLASLPDKEETQQILKVLHTQHIMHTQALSELVSAVETLQRKFTSMVPTPPVSPIANPNTPVRDEEDKEEEVAACEVIPEANMVGNLEALARTQSEQEDAPEKRFLERLETKSLTTQCAKVVGAALRPFRSS